MRQRGSVVVMAAIVISTVVIALASIDIGYLFFQKRDLQKVADLAALAGAQQLSRTPADTAPCASALAVAKSNANQQVSQGFSDSEFVATCGSWDPVKNVTAPHYTVYAAGDVTPTAVSVWVNRSFRSFFGAWANRNVSASAIATADTPIAVFSVESRLLRIDGGAVPKILSDLGVDIKGTSLVSYDGVANAKVTTGGLLAALGFNIPLTADVATIKNTVSVGNATCPGGICPLSDLLSAIKTVGGQNDLIDALGIQTGQVKLLTDSNGHGLLTMLDTANGKAALEANIKAPQLLTTAIIIANSSNAVAANLGATIPGVISADTKIGIVEGPSIGIGGDETTAYTSQVRLFSHVKTDDGSLVSELITKILKVDLPLAIDVVNGKGTIKAMCEEKDEHGHNTARIAVSAPLLKVCVGDMNATSAFSTTKACDDSLGNKEELLKVLSGGLSLSTHFYIEGLPNEETITLSVEDGPKTIGGNPLDLNATLRNISKAVLASVLGKLLDKGQSGVTNATLARDLLDATGNVLSKAVTELDVSLKALKSFVQNLDQTVKNLLEGSLSAGVIGLLTGVGNLLTGLLTGVGNLLGNLLGNLACALSGNYNQCTLAAQLSGNQTGGGNSISNVLLSLLGLVDKLLEPILTPLGNQLAVLLQNLFGINLGQVDVTLIDLKCGGGDNVRLVY